MSNIEEKMVNNILAIIEDNLKLLMKNDDTCLYYLKEFCKSVDIYNPSIPESTLKKFTEDALYALLNAEFLYEKTR